MKMKDSFLRKCLIFPLVFACTLFPLQSPNRDCRVKANSSEYTIRDLGDLGGGFSWALDISNTGYIVGASTKIDNSSHAVVWYRGKMLDITPNEEFNLFYPADASGVNDLGQVVGTYNGGVPFFWENGVLHDLNELTRGGFPNPTAVGPRKINNQSQIAGYYVTKHNELHAFLWESGRLHDLKPLDGGTSDAMDLNDNGIVVGRSSTASGQHAVAWRNGQVRDLDFPGDQCQALAINIWNQVVGELSVEISISAYLWDRGKVTALGSFGGQNTHAFEINSLGDIVGSSDLPGMVGNSHAFLWKNGSMKDLNDLIPPASGWTLNSAIAINDFGMIVGTGVNPQGKSHAFLLKPLK